MPLKRGVSVTLVWLVAAGALAIVVSCDGTALRNGGMAGSSGVTGSGGTGGGGHGANGTGGNGTTNVGGATGMGGGAGGTPPGGTSGAAGAHGGGAGGNATSGGGSGSGGGGGAIGGGGAAGSGSTNCAGLGALEAIWSLPSVQPSAMSVDAQGNVFVTGAFTDTVTFGTQTLTSNGEGDIFLVKYDLSGAVLFATSYGNASNDDPGPALALDADGNVFLSGFFSNTLSFGGTTAPLVAVLLDAFTVKISPTGQTLWADHFGYAGGTYDVASIAVGPEGDPVIAGTSRGTIQLGNKTWMETSTAAQPFVARLASADGAVVWSNAAGGDFDTDKVHVAVDADGRTFLAGSVQSGAGAWGAEPDALAGYFCTFRVGFDPSGNALWSWFDLGGLPVSIAVDSEGRLSVVEDTDGGTMLATVGSRMFDVLDNATLSLLVSPIDGTLISGEAFGDSTFPTAATVDGHGNSIVTGQFDRAFTLGATAVGRPGGEALFMATFDGASQPESAAWIGAQGSTISTAIAVAPSGKVLVTGTTNMAYSTDAGTIQPGTFMAVFAPVSCDDGAGPLGAGTGSMSNHGDLPDGAAVPPPSDAGTAMCPATMDEATNGAACPTAMGCAYGSTCCFCVPHACDGQPTTWTCDPLDAPDPRCPAEPPTAGPSCPMGLHCNYCLPGGRYYADCTAGGWSLGYAQLLCQ